MSTTLFVSLLLTGPAIFQRPLERLTTKTVASNPVSPKQKWELTEILFCFVLILT